MTGSTTSARTVRVEVFLRTQTPPDVVDRLRELVARVRRLQDETGVADVRVKTWSSVRPALEELSDSGPSVALTVNAFRSWADREGYTLRPGFERRQTTSMLDRRPAAELRVPVVCVAVYENDTLRCVAPCSDGERTYTVADCVDALEAGFVEPDPFADRDRDREREHERDRVQERDRDREPERGRESTSRDVPE